MTDNPLRSNSEAIEEAHSVQEKTREALARIRQQTVQTEELGAETMESLRQNRLQTEKIDLEAQGLEANLNKTTRMQDRLDRWAGRWGGRDKREAKADAEAQTARERKLNRFDKENRTTSEASVKSKDEAAPTRNTRITRSKLVKKRPQENPLVDSARVVADKNNLDEDTKAGLHSLADNDEELDIMLGETEESLN